MDRGVNTPGGDILELSGCAHFVYFLIPSVQTINPLPNVEAPNLSTQLLEYECTYNLNLVQSYP